MPRKPQPAWKLYTYGLARDFQDGELARRHTIGIEQPPQGIVCTLSIRRLKFIVSFIVYRIHACRTESVVFT